MHHKVGIPRQPGERWCDHCTDWRGIITTGSELDRCPTCEDWRWKKPVYRIAAYKVINAAGAYAGAGFWFSQRKLAGKTWPSKSALNCSLTYYLRWSRQPLPEDWTVLELTPDGLKEIPAREFYGK